MGEQVELAGRRMKRQMLEPADGPFILTFVLCDERPGSCETDTISIHLKVVHIARQRHEIPVVAAADTGNADWVFKWIKKGGGPALACHSTIFIKRIGEERSIAAKQMEAALTAAINIRAPRRVDLGDESITLKIDKGEGNRRGEVHLREQALVIAQR